MQTPRCPVCGRTECNHSHYQQDADSVRELVACTCMICSGPLADHDTKDHAARVVERLAAIGYPTPVNVGIS